MLAILYHWELDKNGWKRGKMNTHELLAELERKMADFEKRLKALEYWQYLSETYEMEQKERE